MLHDSGVERVELFRLEGRVNGAPVDGVLRHFIFDDELVFWRPARTIGISDDRPVGGQFRFAATDGVLDQQSGREIEMRPAFAQQLGNVADVHRGSHLNLLKCARLNANALFCPKISGLAKEPDHTSLYIL